MKDTDEAVQLEAARSGDEDAFRSLTEPLRHEILVHCYRLLGSFEDAEDALQETWLRAWRRLETFEQRAPLRAWLYKIATGASLEARATQRNRSLPSMVIAPADPRDPLPAPSSEPIWLEPFPEGLQEFYAQPDLQAAFAGLFSAAPTVSIWTDAPGEWSEW